MKRLLLALLPLIIALASAQPFPVSVKVSANVQGFYGPLTYRITVTATRQLDVRVRASVIVPGSGQSEWRTLWEGTLHEGEAKTIEAREDSIPRLGSYVIWVAVDFASPRDFMVIDNRYYYATYDVIHVVTVYEPSAERWKSLYLQAFNESERWKALYNNASAQLAALNERCNALETQLGELQQKYSELEANYASLQSEKARLNVELNNTRAERDLLRISLERAENQVKGLLALSVTLAALSALLAALLLLQAAKARSRKQVPQPPPD